MNDSFLLPLGRLSKTDILAAIESSEWSQRQEKRRRGGRPLPQPSGNCVNCLARRFLFSRDLSRPSTRSDFSSRILPLRSARPSIFGSRSHWPASLPSSFLAKHSERIAELCIPSKFFRGFLETAGRAWVGGTRLVKTIAALTAPLPAPTVKEERRVNLKLITADKVRVAFRAIKTTFQHALLVNFKLYSDFAPKTSVTFILL